MLVYYCSTQKLYYMIESFPNVLVSDVYGSAGGVTVVHKDGSEKVFEYRTDAEYLAEALLEEGLVAGEESQYGLTIITVDGEAAVWEKDSAYWSILVNGEYATTGASEIPVYDGSTYKLEYTSLG